MLALILAILFILVSIPTGVYLSAVYRAGYWRRRGVPGPSSHPFSGNLDSWWGGNISDSLQKWTPLYGKTYGIQEGALNVLVTSDMGMLHELFVTEFECFHARKQPPLFDNADDMMGDVFSARGARWRRLRAVANASFTVANLKKVVPIVNDSASITIYHLERALTDNQSPLNIHIYMQEYTMDVISRVAMGQQGSRQFRNAYLDFFRSVLVKLDSNPIVYYSNVFPWLVSIGRKVLPYILPLVLYFVGNKNPMTSTLKLVREEVQRRKVAREELLQSGEPLPETRDFIDFLLEIESDDAFERTKSNSVQARVTRELTTAEIVSMCGAFLFAGFDTTANTLALTVYYLTKNPEAQERLRAEIDEVCGVAEEDGSAWPSYEQLGKLRYAEACMKETLRLVPIAGFASSRLCTETTTLGEYTVEAGTYVQADVFACQRDPAVWGEAVEEFRPERMLDEERRPLLSWFPFGAGPRTCVGMRLAYLEEKSMMVHLLSKYRLVKCGETELRLGGQFTIAPENMLVKLVPRDG